MINIIDLSCVQILLYIAIIGAFNETEQNLCDIILYED